MALSSSPPTRNRTYVDGVTQVPAGDQNDIQDLEIALATGTRSIKAITVDGVGGVAETPTAGDIVASGKLKAGTAISGATAPTPATVIGGFYKDSGPIGWAYVTWDGVSTYTLVRGVNIASVTRNAAGRITLALVTAAPAVVLGVGNGLGNSAATGVQVAPVSASSAQVQINNTSTLAALDASFFVVLFGY